MTSTTTVTHLRATTRPRARLRADALAAALLAAAAGVVALWVGLLAARPQASGGPVAGRLAIVADAGPRPAATLAAAERTRSRGVAAIRVPRDALDAAADVRYFAAQRYGTIVAVGPLARAATRSVAAEYPR